MQDIPGYFWDEARNRYFKVEARTTAPTNSAYSQDSVKRRKLERQEADVAAERNTLRRKFIQRSSTLQTPLVGGIYQQAFGNVDTRELVINSFAAGLREKGSFVNGGWSPLWAGPPSTIRCLYINGSDDKTGLGVAYMNGDDDTLRCQYVPRDDHDRILARSKEYYNLPFSQSHIRTQVGEVASRVEMLGAINMSTIKYHEPSHHLIITSVSIHRGSRRSINIQLLQPPLSTPHQDLPLWQIGEADVIKNFSWTPEASQGSCLYSCAPAPAASDLLCIMGTEHGILQMKKDTTSIKSLSPHSVGLPKKDWHPLSKTVTSVDFQTNNHNVVLAGGRSRHIWMADLRATPTEWTKIGNGQSVAHIRSVNEHHVVTAGLKNHMALHDIRFSKVRNGRFSFGVQGAEPLFYFDEYKNAAHLINIGFDIDPSQGIAAAAHDDGTVAVYSLQSGRRLKSRDVDRIHNKKTVSALTFATLPRDRNTSLFVGLDTSVHKYSFGLGGGEDDDI